MLGAGLDVTERTGLIDPLNDQPRLGELVVEGVLVFALGLLVDADGVYALPLDAHADIAGLMPEVARPEAAADGARHNLAHCDAAEVPLEVVPRHIEGTILWILGVVVLLAQLLRPSRTRKRPLAVPLVVAPWIADLQQKLPIAAAAHLNQPLHTVCVTLYQSDSTGCIFWHIVEFVASAARHYTARVKPFLNGLTDVVILLAVELARRSSKRNKCFHGGP